MSRYRVLERLGSGTGGTVYRALDLELKREVAIKVMPETAVAHPELLARFHREVRVLCGLSHPNIVRVFEPLDHDGVPAYTMEVVPGQSLQELVRGEGAQPLARALDLVQQAAEALVYIHGLNLCHRDIKPANMMVDEDGRLRVMDFGLARDLSGTVLTQAGVGVGTPRYMPPEAVRGEPVSPAGDVYALALVLHELLTGKYAFDEPRLDALVESILRGPRPTLSHLPGIPRWLLLLQARAVDVDPARRPDTAEYQRALAHRPTPSREPTVKAGELSTIPPGGAATAGGAAAAGAPPPASPRSVPAPPPTSRRQRRVRLAALVGVIAAAAITAALLAPLALRQPTSSSPGAVSGPQLLGSPRPTLPRALEVPLLAAPPPGARLRARIEGRADRILPLTGELVLGDLPPSADVELAVLTPSNSTLGETVRTRTPALAPVSKLACLPTDRDVLVDFDAPPAAELLVEVRRGDGRLLAERRLAPGTGVFHSVFDGLAPETDYTLSVRTPEGWPGLAPYPFRTRGAQHTKSMEELATAIRKDPAIDEYAANLIALWPDSRSVPVLRRLLELRHPRTLFAMRTIGRAVELLRDRDLAILLGKVLPDAPSDGVRASILRAAAISRHPHAAELAAPYINNPVFGVAEGAALCLATAGTPEACDRIAGIAERFEGLDNFVWPMVGTHRARSRTWFRRWLAVAGPGEGMHRAAVRGLSVLRELEDVAIMRERLLSPPLAAWEAGLLHEDLMRGLAVAAGTDGTQAEPAARALEEMHRAHPEDARAIWALARLRRPAALPLFSRALRSWDRQMRAAGIAGLVRLEDRAHLPQLRALLADPTPQVGDLAAWALARLQDGEAVQALLARARSTSDARGVAVWALARLGAPQAQALQPELERLAAVRDEGVPPRLLALAGAAADLRWPVTALLSSLAADVSRPLAFRDAVRAAISRAASRSAPDPLAFEFVPVLAWEPTGLRVYPGDVLPIAVTGTWRSPPDPFTRLTVARETTPDCSRVALCGAAAEWRPRLGAAPGPLLPPFAGELAISPFDADTLVGCGQQLDSLEGQGRLTRR